MDWKEEMDHEAEKEFAALSQKSTSELLNMIKKGDYGKFNKIWRAAGLHGDLKEIGWPFYYVLNTTKNEITRVACAEALLSAILTERVDIKPHHFLDMNENLADNILRLREILIKKIGEK